MTRPHYDIGDIQPIDYMKDQMSQEQFEGFLRGNIMKYISRYPHKGGVDDLEKAQWYLGRLVELKKDKTTEDKGLHYIDLGCLNQRQVKNLKNILNKK